MVREELIPLNSGGERVKRLKKTKQQCIARRTEEGSIKGKELEKRRWADGCLASAPKVNLWEGPVGV